MGLCGEVRIVRALEILDYLNYEGDYEIEMGIGKPPEFQALLETPYILVMRTGSPGSIRQPRASRSRDATTERAASSIAWATRACCRSPMPPSTSSARWIFWSTSRSPPS